MARNVTGVGQLRLAAQPDGTLATTLAPAIKLQLSRIDRMVFGSAGSN